MRLFKVATLVVCVIATGYGAYSLFYSGRVQEKNTVETTLATPEVTPIPSTPVPTPVLIDYSETATQGGEHYIELLPKIGGEQGYVAFPRVIEETQPPALVVYYHGSTQRITTNFKDDVMKNMRMYGQYFSEQNVAFLASNQHGDNFGSKSAVEDSRALVEWVRKRYKTSSVVYVLGFSMGGMPAMRHVVLYPKEVTRIALLAPAQQVETYTPAQVKLFRSVPLKIWHGTADVNVAYWVTAELQDIFKENRTPVVVVTLKGKTHWDVDTEYMKHVHDWFTEVN